jgi:phosphomannomutase
VKGEGVSIFKAYDIRGVYGEEVDLRTARAIGAAFARFLFAGAARRVVVGNDMRASSPAVKKALLDGITAQGTDVVDIGLAETPMLYFAVGHLRADGGVAVTASHNPAQYTGFKMVREDAIPLSGDSGIQEIRALVEQDRGEQEPAARRGTVTTRDVRADYVRHVRSFMRPWRPARIVIDYANGMGGHVIPEILDGTGLQIESLYPELDGTFPNHEANPLRDANIAELARRVRASGAHLGAAFDGDADRCAFVDEHGVRVPSDIVTALIARALVPTEPGTAVVYDLRSSRVVPEEVERLGGRPIRERVGHSFMKAVLRREGGLFGGELSGHFYFRDNFYSDSGIIALVQVLNILCAPAERRPFGEVVRELRKYPSTGEINFEVADKDAVIAKLAEVYGDGAVDFLDGITVQYPGWWFNVRKSNTEPLLRLNLEATDPRLFEPKKRELLARLGTPVE